MVDGNEDDVHETMILVTNEMREENFRNDVISLPEDEATSYRNLFLIDPTASTADELVDYDGMLDMLDGSASNKNEINSATNTAEAENVSDTIRNWFQNFNPNVEGNNSSEHSLIQFFYNANLF